MGRGYIVDGQGLQSLEKKSWPISRHPQFCVTDLPSDGLTHLLIESLSQRLKILGQAALGRVGSGRGSNAKNYAQSNKARYMATSVACGWAGAIFKVRGTFGQEQQGQKPHKRQKSEV